MKKHLMMICILLIGSALLGQDNVKKDNILEVGLSATGYCMGGNTGTGIFFQYSHTLNNYFALSTGISSGFSNYIETGYIGSLSNNFSHTSSYAMNLSLRVTPLPKSVKWFSINVGELYNRMIKTWGAHDDNQQGLRYNIVTGSHIAEHLFGFIGSVNFTIIDNDKITSGLSYDMHTSFVNGVYTCDAHQIRLFLGLKL